MTSNVTRLFIIIDIFPHFASINIVTSNVAILITMEFQLIHVLNRGVDKRKIFLDDQDRFRFIHDLFEFNNQEKVKNLFYFFKKYRDIERRYIKKPPRKLLVQIHAFCLMPNHYHLLLSPKIDTGTPQFMKKLNMGYSKYFNEKYKRKGTLFEGRYKSVAIENESHFIHIPYYIHFNPLDLEAPEWRNNELKNYKKANEFLNSYRWSSHFDYVGKKNFPSVTQRNFLSEFFEGPKEYEKNIEEWLKSIDLENIKDKTLE